MALQEPYHLLPHAKSTSTHHCYIYTLIFKEMNIQHERSQASEPYLYFPGAIIHHAMLGSHDIVAVEFGGVEGNLLHLSDATNGVSLTWACGLILVQPVEEELLKQGGLTPGRHYLDLSMSGMDNKVSLF